MEFDPFSRLLLALPLILAACHLSGALFRRIGQPAVIGEIVAGILLGPSLLGAVAPAASAWLLPDSVVTAVNTLAQLGLVFFMYLVGTEIDLAVVRRRTGTAVAVSQVGIAVTMTTGGLLAFLLYPRFGGGVGLPVFALFVAVVLSVTAFPVLARILADRGMSGTPLGVLALTCAAVGDVVAWWLLALVTALSRGGAPQRVLLTVALTAAFVAVLVFGVRPALARVLATVSEKAVLPILLGGVMLAALATNVIGIHAIFGAFLFGAVTPRGTAPVRLATGRLESVTVTLLLPLFFVHTGLRTAFGLLGADAALWGWCAVVLMVAVVSKWGSTTVVARLGGTGWRDAMSLGALMNCRGLTELVVLNVGLQLKVITPTVFAMLVIMTVVSTAATAPALSLIERFGTSTRPAKASAPHRNGVRHAGNPSHVG
jgi:Kef-type K+ transport system membrane component KefB